MTDRGPDPGPNPEILAALAADDWSPDWQSILDAAAEADSRAARAALNPPGLGE